MTSSPADGLLVVPLVTVPVRSSATTKLLSKHKQTTKLSRVFKLSLLSGSSWARFPIARFLPARSRLLLPCCFSGIHNRHPIIYRPDIQSSGHAGFRRSRPCARADTSGGFSLRHARPVLHRKCRPVRRLPAVLSKRRKYIQ